jgi:hypothetical protein
MCFFYLLLAGCSCRVVFSTEFTAGLRKKKGAKKKENYGGSCPIFTLTSRQSYYKGSLKGATQQRFSRESPMPARLAQQEDENYSPFEGGFSEESPMPAPRAQQDNENPRLPYMHFQQLTGIF